MLNTTCALEYAFILRLGTARTMSVALVMLRSCERLLAERRHRDADVLQLLLAPLGRDDDLVEAREVARLRGRRRRFGLVGPGQLRAAAHHRRKQGDPNRAPDIRRLHARHDNPPRIDSCIQPRT